MSQYQKCTLNGWTFTINPPISTNPPKRSVTKTDTINGAVFTDWGEIVTDREIKFEFPLIDNEMYWQLEAFYQMGGPMPFIDEWGYQYTVIFEEDGLTYERMTPQGDCFVNVRVALFVVSSP